MSTPEENARLFALLAKNNRIEPKLIRLFVFLFFQGEKERDKAHNQRDYMSHYIHQHFALLQPPSFAVEELHGQL